MRAAASLDEFEQLYRNHGRRILTMMRRLCACGADAEDLTQETFVRAWRSWHSFDSTSAPFTWLHTIALRTYADWRRSSAQRIAAHIDDLNTDSQPDRRSLDSTDADLEEALVRLPLQMREAVVLHYIEGFTVSEIADLLGKSTGTVKAQLHAARAKLRAAFQDNHDPA